MMRSGCDKLLQLQIAEAEETQRRRDAEKEKMKAIWENVRKHLSKTLPAVIVDVILDGAFDDVPESNNSFRRNVVLPNYAPFVVSMQLMDDPEFCIPGVSNMQPSIYEGDLYEGRVDWEWRKRIGSDINHFSTMTTTTDPEIALALAASRYLLFVEFETKNQVEYQKLLVEHNEETQKREAEYVPVEAEELNVLEGFGEAIEKLVFWLVDTRLNYTKHDC